MSKFLTSTGITLYPPVGKTLLIYTENTFEELSLTGVLPSRDSKIRGVIARITKTNAILKRPVNDLFPLENTYQDTNQTFMARQQKLRQEAAVIGELKKKYER